MWRCSVEAWKCNLIWPLCLRSETIGPARRVVRLAPARQWKWPTGNSNQRRSVSLLKKSSVTITSKNGSREYSFLAPQKVPFSVTAIISLASQLYQTEAVTCASLQLGVFPRVNHDHVKTASSNITAKCITCTISGLGTLKHCPQTRFYQCHSSDSERPTQASCDQDVFELLKGSGSMFAGVSTRPPTLQMFEQLFNKVMNRCESSMCLSVWVSLSIIANPKVHNIEHEQHSTDLTSLWSKPMKSQIWSHIEAHHSLLGYELSDYSACWPDLITLRILLFCDFLCSIMYFLSAVLNGFYDTFWRRRIKTRKMISLFLFILLSSSFLSVCVRSRSV